MTHYTVKVNERRCCAVEGCLWCDNIDNYGAYVKVKGRVEYRCPKHSREVEMLVDEKVLAERKHLRRLKERLEKKSRRLSLDRG